MISLIDEQTRLYVKYGMYLLFNELMHIAKNVTSHFYSCKITKGLEMDLSRINHFYYSMATIVFILCG